MSESREQIRNRMLQQAARIWGYPETEDASGFDPLVNLLLTVNAAELERISSEIHRSRNRVMERIIQLLAPDVLTGPHQASAILNANSLDEGTRISDKEQFFLTQRSSQPSEKQQTQEIFFTPAAGFYLNRATVKYAATNNKLFRYTDGMTKELLALGTDNGFLPNSSLWLALDQAPADLSQTQFYFQYRSEVSREVFYNQLKYARWSVQEQALTSREGFNVKTATSADAYAQQIFRQQAGNTTRFLQQVLQSYEAYFVTLEKGLLPRGPAGVPEAVRSVFSPDLKELSAANLLWIRIDFPENITSAMLEDLTVFANAFPVVNRKLHDITYRLQDMMNVIPLLTGDSQFFDTDSVTDEQGTRLHVRSNEEQQGEELSILMRYGGAGRFDEREASMVIENLVQLLRDESAAFSKLGKDLISQEIKSLQQSITKIEQLIGGSSNSASVTPYLMVRNQQRSRSKFLYVTYWSTNGSLANAIRPGTRLQPYKTGAVKPSSVFLLTATTGGKNRLSQSDSVVAYKYALLSKDRIMSREDIRLFCRMNLGKIVEEVVVEKGFKVAATTHSGFMKTIDVTVLVSRRNFDEAQENGHIADWQQQLELQLGDRSMAFIPFRVFIKPNTQKVAI
ncbi:type VI secretion system baseplate subunit TssF [Niabella terrae]